GSRAGLGTPNYISPEQAACRNEEICALSDVYSLGAILYELLTGRPPFVGDSPLATLGQVLREEPGAPRTLNHDVDPELEAVCLKCLEKKATERYPSAEALADDLARWLRGEPTKARPRRGTQRIWRLLRRHPGTSAAVALPLISAITATVGCHVRDPAGSLALAQRELENGRPVTLLGESGPPISRWFQRATNDTSIIYAPDGSFSVESGKLGLVELLPELRID